jgi:2-phospho-L-lactate guanylyltransferase
MRVVVPFDGRRPKTRLEAVLDPAERREFAVAMLRDVLSALREAGANPELLATAPVDLEVPVTVDERPLSEAVNGVLAAESPVCVVMADLPLATPGAIERLLSAEGEVVLVPGRGGGTNAVLARHPEFRVDYHGVSVRDHRRIAREIGVEPRTLDSYRLSTDVDEGADLPEVLLHGDGYSRRWLRERGFRVDATDGRVRALRDPAPGEEADR